MTSSSAHSIRITGLSRLTFQHGFSSNLITDLSQTRRQPIQGKFTFSLVKNDLISFCLKVLQHI